MLTCLNKSDDKVIDNFIAAAAVICNSAVTDEVKSSLINCIRTKPNRLQSMLVWFMDETVAAAPEAVIGGLTSWAPTLLDPSDGPVAEHTLEWLTKHIFLKRVFTEPSTEAVLNADLLRMRAAEVLLQRHRDLVRRIVTSNAMVVFRNVDPLLRAFEGSWFYLNRFCDVLDGKQDSLKSMEDFLPVGAKVPPNLANPLAIYDGSIELPTQILDFAPDINNRLRVGNVVMHEIAEFRERVRAEEMEDEDDEDDDDDEIVVVSDNLRARNRSQQRLIMPSVDMDMETQESKY